MKHELYAKSFQVNDMLMKTYLTMLKTQVVNLERDAKDLSCDLQRLEVRGKLGSKTLYSAHSWKSCPKYFVLLSHYIKNYHLNFDFHLNCNFQSLNRHWSVLLDQILLQLDRKGIKESEDGMRGGEGGDYFRYFRQKGAIIWGRR